MILGLALSRVVKAEAGAGAGAGRVVPGAARPSALVPFGPLGRHHRHQLASSIRFTNSSRLDNLLSLKRHS